VNTGSNNRIGVFNNRQVTGTVTRLIQTSVYLPALEGFERLMLAELIDGLCCAMGLPRHYDYPFNLKQIQDDAITWLYSDNDRHFLSFVFLCEHFSLSVSKYRGYVEKLRRIKSINNDRCVLESESVNHTTQAIPPASVVEDKNSC